MNEPSPGMSQEALYEQAVASGESSWVQGLLAAHPHRDHLYPALSVAIQNDVEDLVHAWIPQLLVQVKTDLEQEPDSTRRTAVHQMETLLHTAAAISRRPGVFRWLVDQLHPWCTEDALEQAFKLAMDDEEVAFMETLWPHVRPASVLSLALAPGPPNLDMVDWILVRSSREVRDHHLAERPSGLPLSSARQQAERRNDTAQARLPTRPLTRPRA